MTHIHPTALVDPLAQLDEGVSVGAYSVIGPQVKIGARTQIGPHCVIEGNTLIGQDNCIFQFNSLGAVPQDKKYAGEPCRLEIGDRNTIREFCTFNIGTPADLGVTRLGHDNWIMAYAHLAHDCQVGSHTIFANNAQIAGHVHVGDWVILGAYTAVHQFVQIGAHAMTGMGSIVLQDIPAFVMASGNPCEAKTINVEGLKRRGFSPERIAAVKLMHKTLYRESLTLEQATAKIRHLLTTHAQAAADVELMLNFLNQAKRGIVR
jgi:UDP-N-acetylglucosamine acyltransferase